MYVCMYVYIYIYIDIYKHINTGGYNRKNGCDHRDGSKNISEPTISSYLLVPNSPSKGLISSGYV